MNNSLLGHAIGYATLACLCIAGTAQALPGTDTVNSGDIIDGEVKKPDLAAGSVTGAKVADGSLTAADLLDGTITGTDVLDGTISSADVEDASLTGADVATGGLTGSDIASSSISASDVADGGLLGADLAANTVTGSQVNEASLFFDSAGCKTGLVGSMARVKGSATMPSTFTSSSTYVDFDRHCASGGSIQVRRVDTGHYEVRFGSGYGGLALATPHGGDGDTDNTISVYFDGIVTFDVVIRDQSGSFDDGWFTILSL